MKTLYTFLGVVLIGTGTHTFSQDFINGDLEGDKNIPEVSYLPDGWQAISHTDVICRANEAYKATPDLTSSIPLPSSVTIVGTPQSGETFISALDFGPGWHHEGIQQKLTGLIPGTVYRIHFYQAVIKQNNALDTSGSWMVYQDDHMIGVSSVSSSQESFSSEKTKWDKRSMEFTATAESHVIKFLPVDDDNVYNHDKEDGNLRMGIDNIYLEEVIDLELTQDLEMTLFPNPTLDQFFVKTDLEKYDMTIMDLAGRIVYQQQNCSYQMPVELDQRGVFLVRIQTQDQFAVRRIVIQ
ncbi:MAG: T9SS type A sorting domain-containing protein [Crocinitomicaceae bacterium]|nr:T9SS type A sorting domain-containing protein [Crocinitomicaceae bacterium]